jgi:hypothetical protein
MVYAHAASEPDSMMEKISSADHGWFGGRRSTPPNALENYFRAIDYLEHNIDFPLDSSDDPVESFSCHKHIFFILTIFISVLNLGSAYLAYNKKDQVARDLTKTSTPGDRSDFLEMFIFVCIIVDTVLFTSGFLLGFFCYFVPKAKTYGYLSLISVISIISTLFLCYVHPIYLLTFIVRIVYYVYIRYVVSILHTILLMPPPLEARATLGANDNAPPDAENDY